MDETRIERLSQLFEKKLSSNDINNVDVGTSTSLPYNLSNYTISDNFDSSKDGVSQLVSKTEFVEYTPPDPLPHDEISPVKNHKSETPTQPLEDQRQYLQFKKLVLKYGCDRFKEVLTAKFNTAKFKKRYPLTDVQKDELLDFGVTKIEQILQDMMKNQESKNDYFKPNSGETLNDEYEKKLLRNALTGALSYNEHESHL